MSISKKKKKVLLKCKVIIISTQYGRLYIHTVTEFFYVLTSDISCTSKRGILIVVMSWVQQTLSMFRSPIMAGSRAVMFPDFTLSSTQR